MLLTELAVECRRVIERADAAGIIIDNGNVVDLCADNITRASTSDIRAALVIAGGGFGTRFAKAIRYADALDRENVAVTMRRDMLRDRE